MVRTALLISTACVAGCGGSPDTTTVANNAESWAASSALIGERWRARTVPSAYTHRSLDAAGRALEQTAQTAAQLPDTAHARAWLVQRVRLVRQGVAALDSAVARDDRAATSGALGALAIDRHELDSVARSGGQSQ